LSHLVDGLGNLFNVVVNVYNRHIVN
jgi:hypothetical protein